MYILQTDYILYEEMKSKRMNIIKVIIRVKSIVFKDNSVEGAVCVYVCV